MIVVAFQGEKGSYSEEAVYQHFGEEVETLPCRSFEELFEHTEAERANFGVVPVENSMAGSINKAFDLLFHHDLKVHGEILVRVRHTLMTHPQNGESIRKVRSHPQALAQCEGYLNEHGYEAVTWYDTAGSAKELAANPEPGVGVIASKLAAQHYGLEIVAEGIEDYRHNYTRFFVIGKGDAPRTERSKTSLVFAVPEMPGALYEAISQFASRKINLTKLESRPRRGRLWQYIFYLDFDGHYLDGQASEALVGLLSKAAFVKLLGSYPAAPPPQLEALPGQTELLQI